MGLPVWAKIQLYRLRGRRPWSLGYLEARDRQIAGAIDDVVRVGRFAPAAGYGVGMDERVVEYPWFFEALPKHAASLLDAGSTLNHDMIMDRIPLDGTRLFVTTLAPEDRSFWRRGVSYTYEDLRDLSFRDAYFDCVAALSSLEHVGMDNTLLYTDRQEFQQQSPQDYLRVVAQLKRVLKPGGTLLVTLPYGVAESFGWFQQFDRARLDDFVATFAPSSAEIRFFRYTRAGWEASNQRACDDACYYDVHRGTTLAPDLAAASRAVACLTLIK